MSSQQPTVGQPPLAGSQHPPQPPERDEQWREDSGQLPPRPRRRLLTPAPLALLAVLLTACGFIGGVLVEKGQNGSSGAGAASGFASRLRGLSGAGRLTEAGAAGAASGGAAASGGGFSRPDSGTVAYISGSELYVTTGESSTIKVRTSAATTITKTVTTAAKDIHPGETVVVTGTTAANGTLEAESIRVGASSGSALAGLFGGSSSTGAASGAASSSSSAAGGPALFGTG